MRKAWTRICDENYHRRRQMGEMEIDEYNGGGGSGKKRRGNNNADRKEMEPRIKSKKESNDNNNKQSKKESRSRGGRRKSGEIDVEKQWKVSETSGKTLLTYPPNSGRSRVVSLIAADIRTLDPKQLINDQVVDFWMQYLYKEKLSAKQRARSHVFSSYFFPSLRNSSSHQASRLRNWMKNVKIFTKDFLFVPISLRSHWFLAVICFPHLNISREMLDTFVPKTSNGNGDTSTSDEYSDDEDDIKRKSCILVFDSMKKYTTEHTLVFRTLWNFLTTEARRQNPQSAINFTAATMPASVIEVPQQPNKCDCALFLFKYFESFFTSPIQSYEFPITSMKKWFSRTEVADTRENIYKEILRLTCKYFPENLKEVPDLEYCKREMSGDEDSDDEQS